MPGLISPHRLGTFVFGQFAGLSNVPVAAGPGATSAPIRRALVAALAADAGLVALVGARIYPLFVPQDNDAYPALTYQVIHLMRDRNVGGPSGLCRALVQLTTHTRDLADGEAVAEALRQCLDGPASAAVKAAMLPLLPIGATFQGERDHEHPGLVGLDGSDRRVLLTSVDCLIRYREPRPRGL